MRPEPNAVDVIPPNRDLTLADGTLGLQAIKSPERARAAQQSRLRKLCQKEPAGAGPAV